MISTNTVVSPALLSELEQLRHEIRRESCPKKLVQRLIVEVRKSSAPRRDENVDYDGRISVIEAELVRRLPR
ncbi:MAG: hypothetical protein AAB605_01740 [Patescibacteria group bacterium]